jgi:HPt (histidine-containing phosphotransfer) domain-containing protein
MTTHHPAKRQNTETGSTVASNHSGPNIAVFDPAAALERLEGDRELLEELCAVLKEDCEKTVQEMRQAISQADFTRLEHLAHTLKGSSASLSALEVSAAAKELEQLARDRDIPGASESLEALSRKTDRLKSELGILPQWIGH